MRYRPNWGLVGMTGTDQVGAPVLCGAPESLAPGERGRLVIVPLFPASLPLWHEVRVGHELRLFEGPRVCGVGEIRWIRSIGQVPVRGLDEERFRLWTSEGEEPL